MGKISQGILGGFSGKVGGVVGSSWKGIAVMKAKPLSVANPRTALQVAQRTKFSAIVSLASAALIGICKPMWDRDAQKQSGYNAFVSSNILAYTSTGEFVPGNMNISLGKNTAMPIDGVTVVPNNKDVQVLWSMGDIEGEQQPTDTAHMLAVNTRNGEICVATGQDIRSSEETKASFENDVLSGDTVEIYLAFRSADGFRIFAQSRETASL